MKKEASELLYKSVNEIGLDLSFSNYNKLNIYIKRLLEWNKKINLTSITNQKEVVTKHFIDSLMLIKFMPNKVRTLIDVGTGAGFPGLVIKIFRPDIYILLLDSLQKRIRFLREIISELEIKNIKVIHARAEEIGQNEKYRESFDIVTARAVAKMNILVEYTLPLVKKEGYFFAMKGSEIEKELEEAKNAISLLGGKINSTFQFKLPFSEIKRNIIVIKKNRQTPSKYPRKNGKPTKFPIK